MTISARFPRYRVHLLPLALVAILATTAIPIELRPAVWWDGGFDSADFAENLLLYAPLGVALWGRRPSTVFLVAMALSGAIELLQMWQVARYSSPYDVAANACGALIGALAWNRLAPGTALRADMPLLGRRWVGIAAAVVVGLSLVWSLPVRSSALRDWKPEFALLLGNELTLDRPWAGTIGALALLPRALSAAETSVLRRGHSTIDTAVGGEALYVLAQPVVLTAGEPRRLPDSVAREFAVASVRANAFTVVARITPANDFQEGPARIVSFSVDPFHRNFDLGQEGRKLVLRLRTPVSGENGAEFPIESEPVLEAGREIQLLASYDGGIARIEADGALIGRRNLAATGCAVPALCDEYLPAAWALLGAALAIISLAVVGCRARLPILIVCLLGGVLALILPRVLPFAAASIALQSWSQWTALLGAAAIGLAASPALRR